jgi:hypothetical protein
LRLPGSTPAARSRQVRQAKRQQQLFPQEDAQDALLRDLYDREAAKDSRAWPQIGR